MAKDGTMRGGPRANSGPKKKSLAEKVIEGRVELDSSATAVSYTHLTLPTMSCV